MYPVMTFCVGAIYAIFRTFVSKLSHAKGVFGRNPKFLVDGVETDQYDPRTFYAGKLQGKGI